MTETVSITRRLEFDAGHRIPGHASQCRNLYGYRYQPELTLTSEVLHNGKAANDGIILDFGDVKQFANKCPVDLWNHTFLAYRSDMKLVEFLNGMKGGRETAVPSDVPTVESLVQVVFGILKPMLRNTFGHHLHLSRFILYETPSCRVDVKLVRLYEQG